MRIFLDANIVFSASLSRSQLAGFLQHLARKAELFTNQYALTEAERNIAAKHPNQLPTFRHLAASFKLVPMQIFDPGVKLNEKDRPILCGAIACEADFLLTGDKKDFGHLFGKSVHGVTVITVAQLIAELVARGIVQGD
jgi:predicted nucleic acid-binding protein